MSCTVRWSQCCTHNKYMVQHVRWELLSGQKIFLIQLSAASEKKPEGWQFSAFLRQKGSQGVRNQYFRKASHIPVNSVCLAFSEETEKPNRHLDTINFPDFKRNEEGKGNNKSYFIDPCHFSRISITWNKRDSVFGLNLNDNTADTVLNW